MKTRGTTVTLGHVSGLHGVRGWIKIHSYTDPRPAILDYSPWTLDQGGERGQFEVSQVRRHGSRLTAKLAGLDDRDQAASWVGAEILVDRGRLPPTAENEYYWADLIGLAVETADGRSLGRVERLIETGANDVLVVAGDRQRLIPWLPGRVIVAVDLDGGRIRVDWDAEV